MIKPIIPLEYFKLKPIKAAKVSEVSEATASSGVPAEERVNFHIGNPVQETRLSSAYLRMALGVDIKNDTLTEDNLKAFIEELGVEENNLSKIEFISNLIKKSAPYMPRGGFNKNNPGYLINYLVDWLAKFQQEPLSYDLGEKTGNREIILSSGGPEESLRLFFHSVNDYMLYKQIKILTYGYEIPAHLLNYSSLSYESIPESEKA